MSWTSPHSYATSDVVTAANLNETRDNLNDLSRRATMVSAPVATSETTTSTSYADLSTSGPTVTVTVGASGLALVCIFVNMANNTAGEYCYASFAVSGATTSAASDAYAVSMQAQNIGSLQQLSAVVPRTLTAGSNTFKLQYRVTGGTGTFLNRHITVIPLSA